MKMFALFFPAVLALIACDQTSPTGGFMGTPPIRIAGTWTYQASVTDGVMADCQTHGTIQINQSQAGDQFSGILQGSQLCMNGGESSGDLSVYFPYSVGELSGQSVRFIAIGCTHLGALTGSPANHLTGNASCLLQVTEGGNPRMFTGTWEATR